jgi:Family of unknown function (DUF6714)
MSTESIHHVVQLIEDTFTQTPYPGDDKVAAYARYGRSIADAFRGKHWSEITLDVLRQHRWEIFLLMPETFRYYVPSFMLATLLNFDDVDTLPDNLLFSLTPQREEHVHNYFAGELNDYFSRRVAAFNAEEKTAIVEFLEIYATLYPGVHRLYDIDLAGTTIPFWRQA